MKIKTTAIGLLKAPLRMPFKTALRTVNALEEITVQVISDDSCVGWGSVVPTPAITGESEELIRSDLKELLGWIRRVRLGDMTQWKKHLESPEKYSRSAMCAIDIALHDLATRRASVPLWKYLGRAYCKPIRTNMTISVDEPQIMVQRALDAVAQGFTSLKIKVGLNADLDKRRVTEIRRAVGPAITLRLDANQGWTEAEAQSLIPWFAQECGPLDFIEQPVVAHDLSAMQRITQKSPVPIVADESAMTLEQARKVVELGAAHALSVKLIKAGGVQDAIAILDFAYQNNIPCLMSCMFECGAGLQAAIQIASIHPAIKWVDLDAAQFLAGMPYKGGVQFLGSELVCSHGAGLDLDLSVSLSECYEQSMQPMA